MKYSLTIGFLLGLAALATADEVKLKNGGTLKGTAREEAGNVVVETGHGSVTVPASEVDDILPEPLLPCDEVAADEGCIPQAVAPSAKPNDAKKQARLQPKQDPPKKKQQVQRRPLPEMSPGYTYLGIPPSPRPRGSQNHGYGGISYGLPTPVRGFFVIP